jgi:putative Holliday junction resolvase
VAPSGPNPRTQAPGNRQPPTSGSVLAFDFGERRVGVAVGELGLAIAHPLETIDAADNERRFERIAQLVDEWTPVLLVVGLPLSLDGGEHALSALARKFSQRLHGRFGLPVRLVDERLTSVEAANEARSAGLAWRDAGKRLDPLAAKLILQAFFDENAFA